MRILGVDLGRFNRQSHVCLIDTTSGDIASGTTPTTAAGMRSLLERYRPDLIVLEPCTATGWVVDELRGLDVNVLVANTNHPAWCWRNRSQKSDRDDARMLAQLAAADQLGAVHVPALPVREWRSLILYRAHVVRDRVAVQNRIRKVLEQHAIETPARKSTWSQRYRETLAGHARSIDDCGENDLWRGMLHIELDRLALLEADIDRIEALLEQRSGDDERVRLLRTIPGVGPRLSELVVALIDNPHRFRNGRQVAAYAGLVPRCYASGETERHGRIAKDGNRLLRAYLVEVSWLCLRHNAWARSTYRRLVGTSRKGHKRAIVAVARQLLIRCWAMLRDRSVWHEPLSQEVAVTG
jgi:transposase